MSDYCMIETASDNLEEIKKISDKLLDLKLIASSHIIQSQSTWNWKNMREGATEYLLQMKTKKVFQEIIYKYIREIHSYDCFEFAVYDITSINKEYLEWIDEETRSKK